MATEEIELGEIVKIQKWRYSATVPPKGDIRAREYLVKRYRQGSDWETMEDLIGVEGMGLLHQDLPKHRLERIHEALMRTELLVDWVVDDIVDEKEESGELMFLIKWEGFPSNYNSWEPHANVTCVEKLNDFRKRRYVQGAKGFSKAYWDKNYSPEWLPFMDSSSNSIAHANAVYWQLARSGLENTVTSIADLGFGQGWMIDAFAKVFQKTLKRFYGIEPSADAMHKYLATEPWNRPYMQRLHLQLEKVDVAEWCRSDVQVVVLDDAPTQEGERKMWARPRHSKSYNVDKSQSHLYVCGIDKDFDLLCGSEDTDYRASDIDDIDDGSNSLSAPPRKKRRLDPSLIRPSAEQKDNGREEKMRDENDSGIRTRPQRRSILNRKRNPDKNEIGKLSSCSCADSWDGVYSLILFSSVAQYLDDSTLEFVFRATAHYAELMYFDVPTTKEYHKMKKCTNFHDPYAIHRTKEEYYKMFSKYWTVVGTNLLESKKYYDYAMSEVGSELFRCE